MSRHATVIALLLMLTTPFIANARPTGITSDLIVNNNEQMQKLLKQRDPRQTIDFLHSHINDNAVFNISFQNGTMPAETQKNTIQMDKTGYINSFIQGLHYVDNYNIEIKTRNIEVAQNGKTAIAEQIIIEEGIMLDPNNLLGSGMPFLSKTTCQVSYGLNSGVIQSDKASCYTQTGEVNSI